MSERQMKLQGPFGILQVNRKARWWLTALIVVGGMLYPLSFGPAVWFVTRGMFSESADQKLSSFYRPLVWVIERSPKPIQSAFGWYVSLWGQFPIGRRVDGPRKVPADDADLNPDEAPDSQ